MVERWSWRIGWVLAAVLVAVGFASFLGGEWTHSTGRASRVGWLVELGLKVSLTALLGTLLCWLICFIAWLATRRRSGNGQSAAD